MHPWRRRQRTQRREPYAPPPSPQSTVEGDSPCKMKREQRPSFIIPDSSTDDGGGAAAVRLPQEMWVHVLSWLPRGEVLAVASLVSLRWYHLARDELLWRLICARQGRGPASTPPACKPESWLTFYFMPQNLLRNPGVEEGLGEGDDILEAYRRAVKADPVSAFGGIVAFNVEVDEVLAKEIREFRSPTDGETRMFYEIVVAPSYTEKGLEILRGKSKTLRILEAKKNEPGKLSLRQVGGGWLAQDSDDLTPSDIKFNVVSEKTPQDGELRNAEFAWLCVKHVKSNAIVIAKDNCMLGMGSGQPNRVESLRIAMRKAGAAIKGAALASDAFFPFAWKDAVEEACESGIGVIAEPGGSIRDQDAVDCCNKYGVSLLFTDVRHFRH